MKLKRIFAKKGTILLSTGLIVGALVLSACGVSKEEVASKDQEIANLRAQQTVSQQEVASLSAQLTGLQQDAKYWTQLSNIFMPVELKSMTDHKVFMTSGGLIVALHFDNMDLSKAQNLNWMAVGIPGKYTKQDQARIENLYGKGFTHFHDLMADTHGGKPGAEGVWFMHVAVRDFSAPWGAVKPGVDAAFMPTAAPDVP
ncbi:MAG: hypothetical protein HYX80_05830 [Chloroflexi bacterium]|nr:hypothetical protein [Chloroflexota bacterium]